MFDGTSIEHAFAYLLEEPIGLRGRPHDADVFRSGNFKELGELLELSAKHLSKRIQRITFSPAEAQPGGSLARLNVMTKRLDDQGKDLIKLQGDERENFHWEIVGELVLCIAALLDHLEGKGSPQP